MSLLFAFFTFIALFSKKNKIEMFDEEIGSLRFIQNSRVSFFYYIFIFWICQCLASLESLKSSWMLCLNIVFQINNDKHLKRMIFTCEVVCLDVEDGFYVGFVKLNTYAWRLKPMLFHIFSFLVFFSLGGGCFWIYFFKKNNWSKWITCKILCLFSWGICLFLKQQMCIRQATSSSMMQD